MNPPEHLGVQPGLQLVESPVIRCSRDLPSHNTNRILHEGGIDDVLGLYQNNTIGHFDGDLIAPVSLAGHHADQFFELIP